MSDDDADLDRRLRAAGERWRDSHTPAPADPALPRRTRGWVPAAAAAAVVALVAAGVAGLGERLDGGSRTPTYPAGEGADGVRWDPDLPPGVVPADVRGAVPPVNQHVEFPVTEAAGRYTPPLDEAVGHPPCTAEDVELAAERGAEDGEVVLSLTARDGAACSVSRYPFQQYLHEGRYVEVLMRTPDPRPGDWPTAVLVTERQRAVLRTEWAGWCRSALPFDTIEMIFDDNSTLHLDELDAVTGCASSPPGPERVQTPGWEPEGWTLGPPADFQGLEARLVDRVKGPADLPTWVVELTATRGDIALSTCPSWEVRQGSEPAGSLRLNCSAVPHRTRDGTPYLPQGQAVRFAVWAPYGASDARLTWVLTTPDGPVDVLLDPGPAAPEGAPRLVAEDEANLHLVLSNQSFADPTVRIGLSIDGVELVDRSFEVGNQHTFVSVDLAVPVGEHRVVLTTDSGVRSEHDVAIPARGVRWAAALFSSTDSRGGAGGFDWIVQDSPIAFG